MIQHPRVYCYYAILFNMILGKYSFLKSFISNQKTWLIDAHTCHCLQLVSCAHGSPNFRYYRESPLFFGQYWLELQSLLFHESSSISSLSFRFEYQICKLPTSSQYSISVRNTHSTKYLSSLRDNYSFLWIELYRKRLSLSYDHFNSLILSCSQLYYSRLTIISNCIICHRCLW